MAADLRPFTGPEHQPYTLPGEGPGAALLIHGFPGTPAELRIVAEMLHAGGLTVRGLLLPGFGSEFPEIHRYRAEDWLSAVLAELDALHQEHERVILVGNSMGAALAIQAGARRQVAGAVLFSPFWRIRQRSIDTLFSWLQPVLPTIHPFRRADFNDPRFRAGVQRVLPEADLDDPAIQSFLRDLAFHTSVLAQVRRVGLAGGADAPALNVPAMVIQGARDVLVHPEVTHELVARLPRVEAFLLVDSDHELAHMEHAAERAVAEPLQRFALWAVGGGPHPDADSDFAAAALRA